jgi:hypothetical protein
VLSSGSKQRARTEQVRGHIEVSPILVQKMSAPPRCRACQLQLCKGRNEAPHAALVKIEPVEQTNLAQHFACQTCKVVLINTTDLRKPGWSQLKP